LPSFFTTGSDPIRPNRRLSKLFQRVFAQPRPRADIGSVEILHRSETPASSSPIRYAAKYPRLNSACKWVSETSRVHHAGGRVSCCSFYLLTAPILLQLDLKHSARLGARTPNFGDTLGPAICDKVKRWPATLLREHSPCRSQGKALIEGSDQYVEFNRIRPEERAPTCWAGSFWNGERYAPVALRR